MWHLYNLIAAGDRVQATTIRKVSFDTGGSGAGGSSESERVKLKLTLLVEAVEYDATAAELRVRGRNLTETEFVKMGGTLPRCASRTRSFSALPSRIGTR
jgi:protein pelota